MTTKIITPGTDVYRANCSECGACFTYDRSDVHHNYLRGGEWVSCPQCAHPHMHLGSEGRRQRSCGL
jgi:hypothetical protein